MGICKLRPEQLTEILTDIEGAKIAIIGDFCLDVYWDINMDRSENSVETGLVTHPVADHRYSLGGAGNVAANLVSLGVRDVYAFGVLAYDIFGFKMIDLFNSAGINYDGIVFQNKNWDTNTYIKPIKDNQEMNRFDFGNYNEINETTEQQIIDKLIETIPVLDAIIINQQVLNGLHTKSFRQRLSQVISDYSDNFFIVDSRSYADDYNGTIRKMNDGEALALCRDFVNLDLINYKTDVMNAGKFLSNKYSQPVIITLGAEGCVIVDEDQIYEIESPEAHGEIDTVGAGDSFLSGVCACLATRNNDYQAAGYFGNLVAGVTIKKLNQCGSASPEELIEFQKNINLDAPAKSIL